MPDNYTLLIIPKEKSSAKKIAVPAMAIKGASLFLSIVLLVFMYVVYDYINIKRSNAELARLQKQSKEQQSLIEGLTAKVENFSSKMDALKQFERKIRIMANIEGKQDKQHLLGIGGPEREEIRVKSRLDGQQKELIAGMHKEIDQLVQEASAREKSLSELLEFFREQKSLQAATPSIWPVKGWVTSEFGHRMSPFSGAREFHAGIDIAARIGTPIIAPADGIVVEVIYRSCLGNAIKIDHGHGFSTQYGHLLRTMVKEGSHVKRGKVIGLVGNSGQSTGPHLHYEIYVNNVAINPRKYLN